MATFQASIPLVPALMVAFAAFTHGTEFAVPQGPNVAIEDLIPGDELRTMSGDSARLLWVGSVELTPVMLSRATPPDCPGLVRILPDRFGYARPARDIVLAGGAEINVGDFPREARGLVDYESILPVTPPGPVRMFQLVCDKPSALIANGLSVPSFALSTWLTQQNPLVQDLLAQVLPGGGHEIDVA